ncbi:hypothetical protein T10_5731 [Trichinella papuae]|uniref:Integrase zinc-binding domain-containing protein n=1 Tax=Trichinella papuae TaxID=268474 RepID=A0A0V1MG47_9BILA|nr:hypothetical protein T10_5731 [Trichinella papuae]
MIQTQWGTSHQKVSSADEGRLWKTLGLHWNRHSDHLTFVPLPDIHLKRHDSKRHLLSLKTPPFTIRTKRLFQSLWLKSLEWDDQMALEINGVEERTGNPGHCQTPTRVDVHSQRSGLGVPDNGSLGGAKDVRFVIGKTQIAPVKQLSLPRLELMAALLAARLKAFDRSTCWSDRNISLSWIKGDPCRWKPFAANRVRDILYLMERSQWLHCLTLPSSSAAVASWRSSSRTSSGGMDLHQWPRRKVPLSPEIRLTSPKRKCLSPLRKRPGRQKIIDPDKHNKLERVIWTTAYCVKFVENVRSSGGGRRSGWQLPLYELQEAEKRWIKEIQTEALPFARITPCPNILPTGDPLAPLCPSVDMEGLLLVRGRLSRTTFPWWRRHPLLLPHNGLIVELILNQTSAALRRRIWVARGRQGIKRCIRACTILRKHNGRPFCSMISDRSPERVAPLFPFNRVGLDFARPLHVKDEQRPPQKVYICLFTCMVTQAVHLELVMDMTTSSFLADLH